MLCNWHTKSADIWWKASASVILLSEDEVILFDEMTFMPMHFFNKMISEPRSEKRGLWYNWLKSQYKGNNIGGIFYFSNCRDTIIPYYIYDVCKKFYLKTWNRQLNLNLVAMATRPNLERFSKFVFLHSFEPDLFLKTLRIPKLFKFCWYVY